LELKLLGAQSEDKRFPLDDGIRVLIEAKIGVAVRL